MIEFTMDDYVRMGKSRHRMDAWVEDHGVPLDRCFGLTIGDHVATAHLHLLADGKRVLIHEPDGERVATFDVTFGFDAEPPLPYLLRRKLANAA